MKRVANGYEEPFNCLAKNIPDVSKAESRLSRGDHYGRYCVFFSKLCWPRALHEKELGG